MLYYKSHLIDKSPTHIFKILLLGDAYVGKTSLRRKFMGNAFNNNYMMTLGADISVKMVEFADKLVKLQIWDVAGQENFILLRKHFYKNTSALFLVFDLTDSQTLQNIRQWVIEFGNNQKDILPVILIGNKSDLVNGQLDEINKHVRLTLNQISGLNTVFNKDEIAFITTSAKFGSNVNLAFEKIIELMIENEELL